MGTTRKISIENGVYIYEAKVLRVVDGDTVDLEVDLGFGIKFNQRFRLYAINAPEMKGESREEGKAATAYLKSLIEDKKITIKTFKDEQGKYGRYLADLFVNNECVNELMVSSGNAVEFMKRG